MQNNTPNTIREEFYKKFTDLPRKADERGKIIFKTVSSRRVENIIDFFLSKFRQEVEGMKFPHEVAKGGMKESEYLGIANRAGYNQCINDLLNKIKG